MITNKKTYRYPGTRPFTEDDSDLFYGRNEDITQLSKQIKLEQLIVLYGKSGLGKSSLLNAGVLPQLKKNNKYLSMPVRIGFAVDKTTPTQILLNKLKDQVENKHYFLEKFDNKFEDKLNKLKINESIWLSCKNWQIKNKGKTLLLVFDQFEELFIFNESDIIHFAELIASLLFGEMPQSLQDIFYECLGEDENAFTPEETDELFEKVKVKIIISIRSDRMSFLNSLKTHIPQILQKTYELQPLNIKQAKVAMLEPAIAEGDFNSPKFEYEKVLENDIINYLSNNTKRQIEAFQLQLICQFCENQIIKKANLDKGLNIVNVKEIGELSTIFTRHYDNLIAEIPDKIQQLAARRLIEENMIIDRNRVPLPDKVITSKHNINPELLQNLVNSRLLRSEPNTTEGFSYEISHDNLIEPIIYSFNVRKEIENKVRNEIKRKKELQIANEKAEKERIERIKERKRQRTITFIVGVAAIISVTFGMFGFLNMRVAQGEKYEAEKAKDEAKLSLTLAEKMQLKVETAMFDKAVRERNNKWKSYAIMTKSCEGKTLIDDKKCAEYRKILEHIDTLNLSSNALLRLPAETAECPNLKHINLLGNKNINWIESDKTFTNLNPEAFIYVSVYSFDSIPNQYWSKINGIEILKTKLSKIPENLIQQMQLTYLDLGAVLTEQNNFTILPPRLFKLTNLTNLNLSYCKLTSLPYEIGNLKNLTNLDLAGNQITSLPTEIVNLVNLTNLKLSDNQITSLSTEVGNLANLTYLYLEGNQITSLPAEIGNLANLTYLKLSDNQITSLPTEIVNLTNLTDLDVAGNQITSLPTEIVKLTNLTNLDLTDNQITSLPTEIGNLTNLDFLNLSDNQITSLPTEIANLRKLTSLNLRWNQITSLPIEIVNLANLTNLDLSDNQIASLPTEIVKLTNLTDLDLTGNQITSLPAEIVKLSNLTNLDLTDNQITSLPTEVVKLTNLTELDLTGNQITSLPTEIGNLTNLTELDISYNSLGSLPAEIGNLTNLTFLGLKGNQITSLPAEIENLRKLTTLKLDNNQITSLPAEIGNLRKLTTLELGYNQLTSLPAKIENLANLTYLYLEGNQITSLPAEIGNLTNLTELNLERNNFSDEEKLKIKKLLSDCTINF